jgi:hypothetical protein
VKNRTDKIILVSKYSTFGFSVIAGIMIGLTACGGGGGGSSFATVGITGQVDRMGRPAISTVLVMPARRDAFNQVTNPAQQDPAYRADAITILSGTPFNNSANAATIANTLFPDLLTIDTSKPVGYTNGRAPADDVIDVSLNLLTNGAVTTDNVGPKVYLATFPFLGPPLQPN